MAILRAKTYLLTLSLALLAGSAVAADSPYKGMAGTLGVGSAMVFNKDFSFSEESRKFVGFHNNTYCKFYPVVTPIEVREFFKKNDRLVLNQHPRAQKSGLIVWDIKYQDEDENEFSARLECRDETNKDPWKMKISDIEEAMGGLVHFRNKLDKPFSKVGASKPNQQQGKPSAGVQPKAGVEKKSTDIDDAELTRLLLQSLRGGDSKKPSAPAVENAGAAVKDAGAEKAAPTAPVAPPQPAEQKPAESDSAEVTE